MAQSAHTAPPPFNLDARPGLVEAVSREYAKYCESDQAPKHSGPSAVRAAVYRSIWNRLRPQYSSHREKAGQ